MDARIINIFISAIVNILSTVASTKAEIQKPKRKKDRLSKSDVSSVIELSGNTTGTIAISFTETCILGIVSAMFGEEINELNEEITDAVGEISNMICGQATNKFGEFDATLKAAFSQVVEGKDHPLPHIPNTPIISVPITTDHGEIAIEVSLKG